MAVKPWWLWLFVAWGSFLAILYIGLYFAGEYDDDAGEPSSQPSSQPTSALCGEIGLKPGDIQEIAYRCSAQTMSYSECVILKDMAATADGAAFESGNWSCGNTLWDFYSRCCDWIE